ncbi:eukaryotic initiation factor 4A-6-like [Lolium perenne]|uniref:eukaryotic initiation factor 4A-6-like n=1 Tax=Lolium perenne TaxID=4522 RepID=UPI0021E9E8E4|nr:eukaryotic initiation factor 4A-6-like [Lolium perenne]
MAGTLIYCDVQKEEWKLDTLGDLCESSPVAQRAVFVNTGGKVDWLADKMRGMGHAVSAMHEGMDQNSRDVAMAEFRAGASSVLVASDQLAPGGNDDQQVVSIVVNYDLPTRPENYLHRVGHSGRPVNFVTTQDVRILSDIQTLPNVVVQEFTSNVAGLF